MYFLDEKDTNDLFCFGDCDMCPFSVKCDCVDENQLSDFDDIYDHQINCDYHPEDKQDEKNMLRSILNGSYTDVL